jgi:hypothetical protein
MTDHRQTDRRMLRRIFPKKSTCPECAATEWTRGGYSRGGLIMYRRCTACRHVYRVVSIGQEEDRGGPTSQLVLW